jgi:large subunit ribosomal protein L10
VIKGGILDGKLLTIGEIAKIADLESREVLLAKLAGGMLASLSQAVYLLNAPLAQAARLAGALQAKAEEDPSILKGGAGTPAVAEETESAEAPADAAVESTDAEVPAEADADAATTVSYGIAHGGHGPEPSSTQSQSRTLGTRPRTDTIRSVNAPWKITTTVSELSQR